MNRTLQLEVVTPDRVVLSESVEYVSVTGLEGEFGVLPGHVPFLSALKVGCPHYIQNGQTRFFFISGGFAEVVDNKVLILAESAELEEEIDEKRAKESQKRAEERLAKATTHTPEGDAIDALRAEAALARALYRLKIARH